LLLFVLCTWYFFAKIINQHFPASTGVHYKSIPNFSTLASRIQDLLVKAIAINSGYTSQVIVCTHSGYTLAKFIKDFKAAVLQMLKKKKNE